MKHITYFIFTGLMLFSMHLLSQNDSALAEITKFRQTLNGYSAAAKPTVTLQKTTYDSLLNLLTTQQKQIAAAHKDIDALKMRMVNTNALVTAESRAEKNSVYFSSGSLRLTPEGEAFIKQFVDANGKDKSYTVDGFTDPLGTKEENEQLSKNRAVEVKQYMVSKLKMKSNQVTATFHGSENPVCTNNDSSCNKLNRRVEIRVKK
jgi:outer membrane protein OmpA-like peptidoglycan-associated protein